MERERKAETEREGHTVFHPGLAGRREHGRGAMVPAPWFWVYPVLAGRREGMGEKLWYQQSMGLSPVLLEGQPHVLFHLL